ncbi:DnaT-like ssDNA-binding protein [Desulfolutivibrio sulfoxidireducens]|uniref:DnaT-like ssDNA-binding protein n=1 Tax=Desulfolutivibrio sulfoxidireducens TaxID=2773299 RepID=UPI00159D958D|nr:DnaT-like ssDNA-binding protein [Desulfolutivibrio sulfoxidireducens]QLA18956.1 hypothetical protein GD604_04000 [Desulfolutivibrio sulfoxidireducens]
MPTVTKGTNSYVTEAEATAYFADRLHADAWTEATEGNRQKALLMACKLLDGHILWTGYKTDDAQALAWPRIGVTGVALDVVPASVGIAQMELALILLKTDVTALPDTAGIKSLEVAGAVKLDMNPADRVKVIPDQVFSLVCGYGTRTGGLRSITVRR